MCYSVHLASYIPVIIGIFTSLASTLLNIFQVWIADVDVTSGYKFTLRNKSYNGDQSAGSVLSINYWITFSGSDLPRVTNASINGIIMCLDLTKYE